jgi:hypothetical protein
MKTILLGMVLLLSFSTNAKSQDRRETIGVTLDWERIERGLTTGDFSCKGTCATIKVDWKDIWLTVSGKKYRNQRRADIAYCISEYQKIKYGFNNIDHMEQMGKITYEESIGLTRIYENTFKTIDLLCISRLGKKKANNLRDNIWD